MTTYTIQDFFSKKFETESTKLLLNNKLFFCERAVEDYIVQVQKYPLEEYLEFIKSHPIVEDITSKDITQLSSIEDCTNNMCSVIKENNNPGMSLIEIATALHADNNYKDNTVALSKYGENQIKTAAQLGLAVYVNDLWYLSAVGYIFCSLDADVQRKYLATTILRDPFYSRVIMSLLNKDTNLKDFMTILSESTQIRRTSSCTKVLSFFIEQSSIEGIYLYNLEK